MNNEIKERMNELMNRISLELKDAKLQQGFEIICKRIAELEKELMHLKGCKTCTDRPKGELATVCVTEYEGHCIAQKITHIKELQEENKELKAKIEKMKSLFEIIRNRSCTINIYNIAVEGMGLAE